MSCHFLGKGCSCGSSYVLFVLCLFVILGSNRVVSMSKAHLPPKSTGNSQEAVAPSQSD